MKTFFVIIGYFTLFFGGITLLNLFGLTSYKFFAPKYEEVRRGVFENTQSYTEGKRQEATKLYFEYKNGGDRETICSVVRMSFSNFDTDLLKHTEHREFVDLCFLL